MPRPPAPDTESPSTELESNEPLLPLPRANATAFDTPAGERFTRGTELGRGGMGVVTEATDTALGRSVAIKHATSDRAESVARFAREARITARLEHPAIVPVHDLGRDADGRPYYVMRRIEGVPLAERVRETTTLRERLALVPNVLAAVDAAAYAHARRVIHRDIKPWNIIVGEFGETLLIDWGLARELDAQSDSEPDLPAESAPASSGLTQPGRTLGTPGYMAPEQARAERVDARADVHALGATLLHVLVGRKLGEHEPPPFEDVPGDVPRELLAITTKAMAPDAAERYPDAGALAADLRAFLAGQLVAAHEYSLAERIRVVVRRHRLAVAVGAFALIALIVVGAIAIRGVVSARDQADAARVAAERALAIATERADALVLEQARGAVRTDPAHAIALLQSLGPAARVSAASRDVAAAAVAGGIARTSRVTGIGAVEALALAPDGLRLASGDASGAVHVHDLATAAARPIAPATGRSVLEIIWTADGTQLVIADRNELAIVDIATGTRRVRAQAAARRLQLVPGTDRLRYHDVTQRVLAELALGATTTATVVATDVDDAALAPGDDRIVVLGPDRIRVVDAEGVHDLGPVPGPALLARAGARVAVVGNETAIEIDVGTRTVLRRFSAPGLRAPVYVDGELHGVVTGRQAELVDLARSTRHLLGTWSVLRATGVLGGEALVTDQGEIAIVARGQWSAIAGDRRRVRAIAGDPSSPILAIGTLHGEVMWWDTRTVRATHVVPVPVELGSLCDADASGFALVGDNVVTSTWHGRVTQLTRAPYDWCTLVQGRVVLRRIDRSRTAVVDRTTGTTIEFTSEAIAEDPRTGTIAVARDHTLYELAGVTLVKRWNAPGPIARIMAAANRAAVLTTAGELWRVGLRDGTAARLGQVMPTALIGIAADGTVWVAQGRRLDRYATATPTPTPVGTLPDPIEDVAPDGWGGALITTDTGYAFYATAAGIAERTAPRGNFGSVLRGDVVVQADTEWAWTTLGRSGIEIRRPTTFLHAITASADGRWLVLYEGLQERTVRAFVDLVPDDPAQFDQWLARAR